MKTTLREKVKIHYSTATWFINLYLCLKLWKFRQRKQRWTRNGKNWRKFRRGTWRKSKGRRALQFILHHWWTSVIWKMLNWRQNTRNKGRLVLRGDTKVSTSRLHSGYLWNTLLASPKLSKRFGNLTKPPFEQNPPPRSLFFFFSTEGAWDHQTPWPPHPANARANLGSQDHELCPHPPCQLFMSTLLAALGCQHRSTIHIDALWVRGPVLSLGKHHCGVDRELGTVEHPPRWLQDAVHRQRLVLRCPSLYTVARMRGPNFRACSLLWEKEGGREGSSKPPGETPEALTVHMPPSRWTTYQTLLAEGRIIPHFTKKHWCHQN